MVRGEIYLMDLAPRSGAEQMGRRPGVIVSNDAFSDNPRWRSVTIVPLTSAERWQTPSPTTIQFHLGECNLPRASAALVHQVTTLDKRKIVGPPIGRLSADKLEALREALSNYLLR
jgi:mRNA-degrading endonuclease toxin of MazEF toxin-antitoxin module